MAEAQRRLDPFQAAAAWPPVALGVMRSEALLLSAYYTVTAHAAMLLFQQDASFVGEDCRGRSTRPCRKALNCRHPQKAMARPGGFEPPA